MIDEHVIPVTLAGDRGAQRRVLEVVLKLLVEIELAFFRQSKRALFLGLGPQAFLLQVAFESLAFLTSVLCNETLRIVDSSRVIELLNALVLLLCLFPCLQCTLVESKVSDFNRLASLQLPGRLQVVLGRHRRSVFILNTGTVPGTSYY